MRNDIALAKQWIKKHRIPLVFILVNMIINLAAHLPWINEIPGWWRATQTLLTTFWFKQEGISFFHYQTPLFGPPWQVPFEFPLYQAICSVVSNIFSISIITASHLTSLLIFYISSVFLFLICYEYFQRLFTACVIFAVYLWLPFNFVYSNEILIDYLALGFALGFIYLAMKWFSRPTHLWVAGLATLFLIFGALVKITTMPVVVFPFLFLCIRGVADRGFKWGLFLQPKNLWGFIKTYRSFITTVILMVLIPLLSALLWTYHTDSIKLANPLTVWLSSKNLADWNYGTLEQKLNLKNWWDWIKNIYFYFFLGVLIIFPILSLYKARKAPNHGKDIIFSALFGSFLTIFIFFNLYQHRYYYIAISAFISILIGYGLDWTIMFFKRKVKTPHFYIFMIILAGIIVYPGYLHGIVFRSNFEFDHAYVEHIYNNIARQAQAITPMDGYVISIQKDWESSPALAAERKILVIDPRNSGLFTCEMVNSTNYTTVIEVYDSPDTEKALACFEYYEEVTPGVYRVWR